MMPLVGSMYVDLFAFALMLASVYFQRGEILPSSIRVCVVFLLVSTIAVCPWQLLPVLLGILLSVPVWDKFVANRWMAIPLAIIMLIRNIVRAWKLAWQRVNGQVVVSVTQPTTPMPTPNGDSDSGSETESETDDQDQDHSKEN